MLRCRLTMLRTMVWALIVWGHTVWLLINSTIVWRWGSLWNIFPCMGRTLRLCNNLRISFRIRLTILIIYKDLSKFNTKKCHPTLLRTIRTPRPTMVKTKLNCSWKCNPKTRHKVSRKVQKTRWVGVTSLLLKLSRPTPLQLAVMSSNLVKPTKR